MITDITPFNFPASYLSKATVNEAVMGEKSITANVKISADVVPDFKGWYVVYKGEKYVLPIRKPQGSVAYNSLNASYELTFQHWAVYQLKRYLFAEMAEIGSDSVIPDKYEASLGLDFGDFVEDFNLVLDYYYGGQIKMQLNPDFAYPEDKTMVSISKSKIWAVLQQLYELYAVTWYIEPASDNDNADGKEKYVIKVGYPAQEMSHVFRYGFEGGLMKAERQVQSSDMVNVLLGRGGEKNRPYRYFKQTDENNVSFSPDPDWIPELADVYMDRLHDINFRYYVQGWKDAHYYLTATMKAKGAVNPNLPDAPIISEGQFIRGPRRYAEGLHWAYDMGYTDEKFDPVEYVKDDRSIAEYGELWSCLEDNDDIFPTIQGIGDPETGWGIGRVDQTVDVEQVTSDDVAQYADENATLNEIGNMIDVKYLHNYYNTAATIVEFTTVIMQNYKFTVSDAEQDEERAAFMTFDFDVPSGSYLYAGNGLGGSKKNNPYNEDGKGTFTPSLVSFTKYAYDVDTNEYVDLALLKGKHTYIPVVKFKISTENLPITGKNDKKSFPYYKDIVFNYEITSIKWGYQSGSSHFANTFDIWIKDIWHSTRNVGETDEQFVERVWTPILGDKENETAKVVFSSGRLAVREDYEFEIYGGTGKAAVTKGVHFDNSRTLQVKDKNGNVTATYQSMWRLTLIKSDADLDSIGLYVPSTKRQGNAGDYFFFTGIDMPHQYVLWAEQRLHNYKIGELDKVSDIKPQWAVTFDKIRIQELQEGEVRSLISQIRTGGVLKLQDDRMLPAGSTFYVKSLTVDYSSSIYPTLQVTLSEELTVSLSTISTVQGEVSALQKQIGTLANIEALVRIIGDKLYLRKDGQPDVSYSATVFQNIVKSGNFTQGRLGGSGWAIYKDGKKNTVLEVDKAVIRESMEVTELVVHQTEYVGGSRIESAASIKCNGVNPVNYEGGEWRIVSDDSEPQAYQCFFDTKEGTVQNLFKVDDVAYSHVFDPTNTSLKYYKRKVLDLGDNYIVLSNADEDMDGEGVPAENDVIIHYGNYTDEDRQYVKVSDVIGGGYERYVEGLDSVTASGAEYYFAGKMINADENVEGYRFFVGRRDKDYMEWKNGELTIKGKLTVDSTIGDDTVEDYVNGIVDAVAGDLEGQIDALGKDLQQQIDGQIETWFYAGVPTLTNIPAKNWTTNNERNNHIGDLYYDKDTGRGYRFMLDNGIYKWVELQDTDITKALADASKAQATADGKMTVFSVQPVPPYAKGDIWVNAGNNKDIKVCVNARSTGNFVASDWGLASDYDCTEVVIENGIITGGTVQLKGKDSSDPWTESKVKAGITGSGKDEDSVRIWAGSTFGERGTAPFRVTQGGKLFATEANIEGNIKTPEGGLSNNQKDVVCTTTTLLNGQTTSLCQTLLPVRFWAGTSFDDRRKAPFRVMSDGSVFMNNATLEGDITIGGILSLIGDVTAAGRSVVMAVKKPKLSLSESNKSSYLDSNGNMNDSVLGLYSIQIEALYNTSLVTIGNKYLNDITNAFAFYGQKTIVYNRFNTNVKLNLCNYQGNLAQGEVAFLEFGTFYNGIDASTSKKNYHIGWGVNMITDYYGNARFVAEK